MKRGPALVVLLVHIGSIFYQELHHVQILINTGLREDGRRCPGCGRIKGKRKREKKIVLVFNQMYTFIGSLLAAGSIWAELPML